MTTLMSRLFVEPMVKARVAQTGSLLAACERAFTQELARKLDAEILGSGRQACLAAPTETRTEHNLQGPWCCAEGQRLRLFVPCAECADTSAAYSAVMAPVRGDEA